jgi:ABC-type multidrug transport system fused ATPase/permease subunit
VRDFDRILVLEHGRVVDSGTHDDLIGHEGVYREMAFRQGLAPRAAAGLSTEATTEVG